MHTNDGEILTMRPEGFTLDVTTIETYLSSLPGAFRRSEGLAWVLVVPATDLPRVRDRPPMTTRHPGDPHFVLVWVDPGAIKVQPGMVPDTWARAQVVVRRLLEMGTWRISGQDRDLGSVRSFDELYKRPYRDPDLPTLDPSDPTESPPRVGELTTFRRYLTDPDDANDYVHEFLRVHDSGAFSFLQYTADEERLVTGTVTTDEVARLRTLVAHLDFGESSPGHEGDFDDRVAVIIERPGSEQTKTLDAKHPPPTFATLVRLMEGWSATLNGGQIPSGFTSIRSE